MANENLLMQERRAALAKYMIDHGLYCAEERYQRRLPARQMLGVTIMKNGDPHWLVRVYCKDGKFHVQLRPADKE